MSRKLAREYAYKLVFEFIFNQDNQDQITKDIIFQDPSLTKIDGEYINSVLEGVKTHYDELMGYISRNAKNFRIDRIFKVDLAILLLAVYEMKYMEDIPISVSISEAVSLVKEYSTEKSYMFVNGVLAGINKELMNKC